MVNKNSKPLYLHVRLLPLALMIALVGALTGPLPPQAARAGASFVESAAAALPGLTPVENTAAAWGDFDSDEDLDLVVTGTTAAGAPLTQLLRYDAAGGVFQPVAPSGLANVGFGAVAWGDYDLDNDLDLLLAGRDSIGSLHTVLKLYQNAGGTLTDSGVTFPFLEDTGLHWGSADWGDFDADGDLDLLLTGATDDLATAALIYRNEGGTFAFVDAGLRGVYKSTADWVDYNNDGRLDVFLAGEADEGGVFAGLYEQTAAGVFSLRSFNLPGVMLGSSDWGDFDADGDLDLLIAGLGQGSVPLARVYPNTGSGFAAPIALPVGLSRAAVAWGDFDNASVPAENDGRVDALVTGAEESSYLPFSAVYRYDPATQAFTAIGGFTPAPLARGAVLPGDVNGDGSLDFALLGRSAGGLPAAYLYLNTPPALYENLPPAAPTLQPAVISYNNGAYTVQLTWNADGDDLTPTAALSAQVSVRRLAGTPPYLVSPQASALGWRYLSGLGNAYSRASYQLTGLPHDPSSCPVYAWSAQNIDASYAASFFADEGRFAVNRLPTAQNYTVTIRAGETITVTQQQLGIGDPDAGDAPAITSFGAGGVDPQTFNGLTLALNPDGVSFTVTAPAALPANQLGDSPVDFTVTDACGGVTNTVGAGPVSATLTLSAVNTPPTAQDDSAATEEGTPVTVDVLANDDDVNGQALTVLSTTAPANGTAEVTPDSTITYTPTGDFNGVDTFVYTVSDGTDTATATVTVTVGPVNDPPAFSGDPYTLTLPEDAPPTGGTVTVNDPENDALTFSAAALPTHGLLTVDPSTGAYTYTPNPDYFGDDTFSIRVAETQNALMNDSAIVNVTVTPVNDAPTADPVTLTVAEDAAAAGRAFSFNDIDSPVGTLIVTPATQPAHGVLVIHPDNTFDYTPSPDYFGPDSFTYQVSDGQLTSAPAEVSITVTPVNDPPTAVDDVDIEINENSPPTLIDVLANDSDIDSPAIHVSAITQAVHGVVSRTGDQVFYRPNADYNGPDSFTYTITDGSLTATANVVITVLNVSDAPEIDPIAAQTVVEDTLLTVTPSATDPNGVETLTFSAALLVDGAPQPLPPGAAIDPVTGIFTWTPPEGSARPEPYRFEITVTDVEDLSASAAFDVTVEPDTDLRLTVVDTPDPVDSGENLEYQMTVTNVDPHHAAADLVLTATLQGPLTYRAEASSPECSMTGSALTCALDVLEAGTSRVFTVSLAVAPNLPAAQLLEQTFQVASAGHEATPTDNQAEQTTSVRTLIKVYEGDDTPGDEWSNKDTSNTPSGRTFMGEFNNETVTLTLPNLPDHTAVTVRFDLFILRSWDGNNRFNPSRSMELGPYAQVGGIIGPDIWELNVGGSQVLIHSTFANWSHLRQAFPGSYPGGDYAPRTGAVENGTLGYEYYGITEMDSVYHFELTFLHTDSTLTLNFRDLGLQPKADEAWGLDNVQVTILAAQSTLHTVFMPVTSK